ncbi:MAG: histidinol-phosphate transaminase, partial [Deltaproteobacteria bacterium]|nr:histidinol-phosphate transaminase [Deltaproteobacteria bacterium]
VLGIKCSFCAVSSEKSQTTFQRRGYSICPDCLILVKEILAEFSKGEVFEGRGRCSFCREEHGGDRLVFQGHDAKICNECVSEGEKEITGFEINASVSAKESKGEGDLINFRVRKGIRDLSSYTVPEIECPIKLDGNESPFSLPPDVLSKVLEEIIKIPVNRYPDPNAAGLRTKISQITGFPLDGILLGNGSDELIEMALITFSGGSGKVLIPAPTFSMFKLSTIALGLEPLNVELDPYFDIDLDLMMKVLMANSPDLTFLASPNNPTGNSFSEDRMIGIIENSKGIVVIDEAYTDFCGKSHIPLIDKYENLVVLRTMSKIGFAGMRLGILFARDHLVREINKVRLPYNIDLYSQRIAEVILEDLSFVSENIQLIIRERERLFKELKRIPGIEAFPSDANFILLRVIDADRVHNELIDRGIIVRNFNSPGRLENCLRVTIGTPDENDSFINALRDIISP